MRRFAYFAPDRVDAAVGLLQEHAGNAKVVAGGTDLVVQMKDGARRPAVVVNISGLPGLDHVEERSDGLHIGALVKMGVVEHNPVFTAKYPALVDSSKLVGSIQIRNLATIAGNTCNASPGADTPPALLALGASVQITGPAGTRIVPIDQFFTGPGQTVLQPGELVTEFIIPRAEAGAGAFYHRHTPRKELDIAVVGAGAWVKLDGDRIVDARIGLAAVAPTPLRATNAEAVLRGAAVSDGTIAQAAAAARDQVKPISDVRGSADFRRHLVEVLTDRALHAAIRRAKGQGPAAGARWNED